MKKNFKRLFALLLTLCMLATLMVPAVFAEEVVETESPAVSADVVETYPIRIKDMTHTDPTTAEGLDALMVKTGSTSGTNYYNYDLSYTSLSSAYSKYTLNWAYVGTSGTLTYRKDRMYQARLSGKGAWAALKIRVTEPGAYTLSMITDKTVDEETEINPWTNVTTDDSGAITLRGEDWAGDITAYIIPVSVYEEAIANGTVETTSEDGSVVETVPAAVDVIPDLMTDEYCVGTDSMAADEDTVSFCKTRMEAGEYVVVYTASEVSYCLSEMTLSETAEDAAKFAMTEVASYDLVPYDLTNIDPATYAGTYNADLIETTTSETTDESTGETVTTTSYSYKDYISISTVGKSGRYADLGWKYLCNTDQGRCRSGYMYQPALKTKGTFMAIQLNVPESGFMYLSLTTDKSAPVDGALWATKNSAATWAGNVTAYLVPMSELTATDTTTVGAAMTAENCVGSRHMLAEDTTLTFDRKYMEAGEYALVFTADVAYYAVGEVSLNTLALDATSEVKTTETYNIGLYNETSDPTFAKYTSFDSEVSEGVNFRAYADAAYEAGTLNWKLENYADLFTDSCFTFRISDDQGMKITTVGTSEGDWWAYRIRVPQGGYYSINFNSTRSNTGNIYTYMFPATSDAMSAEEIAAQMTEQNALFYRATSTKITDEVSVGYLEGEYIIAIKAPHADTNRAIYLRDITLETETFTAADVQYYNFNLYDETNCYYSLMTDVYTAVTDETTSVTTYEAKDILAENSTANWRDYAGLVLSRDSDGNVTSITTGEKGGYAYQAIMKSDGSGYPYTLNWRPDYLCDGSSTTNAPKLHLFSNGSYGARVNFGSNGDGTYIASYTLRVDKAGTYDLSITADNYNYAYDVYFVDTLASFTSAFAADTVAGYTADSTWLVGNTTLSADNAVSAGTVTVDAAGDYLIIFKTTSQNKDLYLNNITLTPVVEETAAGVGGETYASLDEALEAANVGDTVHMLNTYVGEELSVPAGVTLNLNGQVVVVDSFDASAASAQIIDTTDGTALLTVNGEALFAEDNAQLPLVDEIYNGYRLYNVDVEAVTVTGKSGTPKYWFRVNFSNKAACDLIDATTELRIQADLTWDDMGDAVAVASADAAFSVAWASKYVANDSIYITVSAVNADDVAEFVLAPQVAANGVVISGEGMA